MSEIVKNSTLQRFQEFEAVYKALLTFQTFDEEKYAYEWLSDAVKCVGGVDPAVKAECIEPLKHSLILPTDLMAGTLQKNLFAGRIIQKGANPNITGAALLGGQVLIDYYKAFANDMELDLSWMLVFKTIDLRKALAGKFIDYISTLEVKKILEDESIPYTTLGYDKASELHPERFGLGLRFNRRWIENNGQVNINDAITNLRLAFELKKCEDAFDTLIANTDGTPTTWDTNIIKTVNKAYSAKAEILRTQKKYGMTPKSIAYLYFNPAHTPDVNQAFLTVRGPSGNNAVIEYNVIPVPSYHIPSTLVGLSNKKGGVLVFPQRKLYYGIFDDLFMKDEFKFNNDALEIGAQEYHKFSVAETKQVSLVPFEA